MGYNHQRIKANARTFYRNNSGNSIIVLLIFTLLTVVLVGIYGGAAEETIDSGSASSLSLTYIIYFCGVIFGLNILNMGVYGWFRRSIYEKREVGSIFGVFRENYMGKVGTVLLRNLYVTLWSLLFYIPGVIKWYEYSMLEYIKEENPSIPAQRCLEISRILTMGHKGDLFYLDLSFIGWHLLSGFTLGILEVAYVGPYYNSAKAFAYEELKAEAFAAGKLDPAEISGYTQSFGGMGGSYGANPNNMGGSYGANPNNMNNSGVSPSGNPTVNLEKDDSSIYYTPKD